MSGLRSSFQEAPAVDLSLTDCPAAVLDHGSHVFVWLAPGLAPAEWVAAEAQCRRFALSLGADRVPAPEVRGKDFGRWYGAGLAWDVRGRGLTEKGASVLGAGGFAESILVGRLRDHWLWLCSSGRGWTSRVQQ